MRFSNFHMREGKKYTPPGGVSLRQRKQLRVRESSSIRCTSGKKKFTKQSYNKSIFLSIAGFFPNLLIKRSKEFFYNKWTCNKVSTHRHTCGSFSNCLLLEVKRFRSVSLTDRRGLFSPPTSRGAQQESITSCKNNLIASGILRVCQK